MSARPSKSATAGALEVYDGLRRAGSILRSPNDGRWLATRADGRRLGDFPDQATARAAVLANGEAAT